MVFRFVLGWGLPIALEDIPDESVVKDGGGRATLLNPDGPTGPTPDPAGKAPGAPDVEEETDPERHCVEADLRTGGTEPALDSESGLLILLKVARVV